MSTAQLRVDLPLQYKLVVLALLLVTFAYAVLTAQILLWLLGLLTAASIGLFLFVIFLFYRLVVAVEQLAAERN